MNEIKAYIRTSKVDQVLQNLKEIGIEGITLIDVMGLGALADQHQSKYSIEYVNRYSKIAKIEIICRKSMNSQIIEIIKKTAYTGFPGDGYIFVSPVNKAIKIRTGEEGIDVL